MSSIKPPEFRMNFSDKIPRDKSIKGNLIYIKQKIKSSYVVAHPLFTTIIAAVVLVCFISGIIFGSVLGYIKTSPPVTEDQLSIKTLTSFIYDDKGSKIAELKGSDNKNRILVQDKNISEYLKKAIVAIEDERFEGHKGIDFKRTFGATINFIFSAGSSGYGGSTITQQVVKLLTGDSMRSVKRKVQEQWRALQLEQKVKKWQILELYLNLIYLGNSYYGVESASLGYFNKPAKDLTLAESAALAGITNAPTRYNPYTEKGQINTLERQKLILDKMLELGSDGYNEGITQEEYNQAINEKIVFAPKPVTLKETSTHSYFVDQIVNDVRSDLMTRNGMSKEAALKLIYNHGLKIYTTQSMEVQKAMDDVFINHAVNIPDTGKAEHPQAAMVIINPSNGQVKAMYGGYGKKEGNILNRATSIARQAGSAFKPIAVYGPAIDQGLITSNTIYDDSKMFLKGTNKPHYPKNSPDTYDGKINIKNAVSRSKNTVAVKVLLDLSYDISLDYLKKVGIDRDNPVERNVSSLALGGLNTGVNPSNMAAAYVPFVNEGLYYTPTTYTKVLNSEGKILLENKPAFNKVYSPETTYEMTDLLHAVVTPDGNGTGRGIGLINGGRIPIAGKTGTTNNNIDSWFVGYTPYYVGAVWYGYDNSVNFTSIDAGETRRSITIWKLVMDKVHADLSPRSFASSPEYLAKKTPKKTAAPTPTEPPVIVTSIPISTPTAAPTAVPTEAPPTPTVMPINTLNPNTASPNTKKPIYIVE